MKTLHVALIIVKNGQELTWGRLLALKVKKYRIKHFWGFISYLNRICPAMGGPTRHDYLLGTIEKFNEIQTPIFTTQTYPMILRKYMLTLSNVSGVLLT